MRVLGSTIGEKVTVMNDMQMVTHMKGNITRENLMEKGDILG